MFASQNAKGVYCAVSCFQNPMLLAKRSCVGEQCSAVVCCLQPIFFFFFSHAEQERCEGFRLLMWTRLMQLVHTDVSSSHCADLNFAFPFLFPLCAACVAFCDFLVAFSFPLSLLFLFLSPAIWPKPSKKVFKQVHCTGQNSGFSCGQEKTRNSADSIPDAFSTQCSLQNNQRRAEVNKFVLEKEELFFSVHPHLSSSFFLSSSILSRRTRSSRIFSSLTRCSRSRRRFLMCLSDRCFVRSKSAWKQDYVDRKLWWSNVNPKQWAVSGRSMENVEMRIDKQIQCYQLIIPERNHPGRKSVRNNPVPPKPMVHSLVHWLDNSRFELAIWINCVILTPQPRKANSFMWSFVRWTFSFFFFLFFLWAAREQRFLWNTRCFRPQQPWCNFGSLNWIPLPHVFGLHTDPDQIYVPW